MSGKIRLALWCVALFAAALFLNTRHNDFPYFYHPDEPGKVEQVQHGDWNFHHPMLLLSGAKLAQNLTHATSDQAVVETGRWVSAFFTALAVVALSLLAFVWRGWVAALIAGLTLLGHHQLFELAHYFKEDSALLVGLAASFLALLAFEKRPSLWRAALLGGACGLAVSGKYLGIIGALLALPLLWREPRRGANFAAFALGLIAIFALINLPLLLNFATFRASFDREMDYVVHGQRGMTRSVPHAQYWNVFIDNTTPAIWVLLIVFLIARWRTRRELTLAEWLLIAFPFVYALALSFSPKSNDRYFLPATAMITLLAALGALDVPSVFRASRKWIAVAGVVLVLAQAPSWWRYYSAFQHDDTAELIQWLNTQVPPNAVIAKDSRIQLPDPDKKSHADRLGVIPQRVVAERFAADVGTLDALRAQGVNYVAVSESDYGKFFLKSLRPRESERADFDRRQAFYEALFASGKPIFERKRGTVIYLHPGIQVYALKP